MFATHALLALMHHDADTASPHAWAGAHLLATTAMRLNAFLVGLSRIKPKK